MMNTHAGRVVRIFQIAPVAAVLVLLAGCSKGHVFHPPSVEKRVRDADSVYRTVRFDTIEWRTASERLLFGNEVYARRCDKCHGVEGEAGTAYAAMSGLVVPPVSAWTVSDPDSARHVVFTGHVKGMPTWGVAGLTLREIDAVSGYAMDTTLFHRHK